MLELLDLYHNWCVRGPQQLTKEDACHSAPGFNTDLYHTLCPAWAPQGLSICRTDLMNFHRWWTNQPDMSVITKCSCDMALCWFHWFAAFTATYPQSLETFQELHYVMSSLNSARLTGISNMKTGCYCNAHVCLSVPHNILQHLFLQRKWISDLKHTASNINVPDWTMLMQSWAVTALDAFALMVAEV